MNKLPPIVSVVMTVFNGDRFLSQSIKSILTQSFEDFEFIIVDDGSTDHSWEIISKYQESDIRVKPIRMGKNQGVAKAANTGLEIASGKYIARMDSDDISLPNRLAEQVAFMESHPDVGILGGRMRYMNEDGTLLNVLSVFQKNVDIHWTFLFESPFLNPTVMFRKSLLDRYELRYEPSAIYGEEDYELWSRFLSLTRGANLPNVLLYYRINTQSLTKTHGNTAPKIERDIAISTHAIQLYLPDASVTEPEIVNLQRAIVGSPPSAKSQRSQLIPVYFKIWDAFIQKNKDEELNKLKQTVFAWAARLILYPLFQPGTLRALWQLTRKDVLWPLYFVSHIPYFISRRYVG